MRDTLDLYFLDQREDTLNVDLRGFQKHFRRRRAEFFVVLFERRFVLVAEQFSHERISVGVYARRFQTDEYVAGNDILSFDDLFLIDDPYGKAREVMGKPASPQQLLAVGKIGVLGCAVIATVIAPFLDNPAFGGIFTFIQEFQGFLSPGVLAVFLFGFFVPKCPRIFGWLGILLGAVFYASFKWIEVLGATDQSFLNRMGFAFIAVCVVGIILTIINHLKGGEAVVLTDKGIIEMKTSTRAKVFGWAVIILTVALYIIFW